MVDYTSMKIALIILGIMMFFLVCFYKQIKGYFDVFDPFYWVTAVYFAVMVFAPYTWVLEEKYTWHGYTVLEMLIPGTIYFGISYFVFFVISLSGKRQQANGLYIVESQASSSEHNDEPVGEEFEHSFYIRWMWIMFIFGLLMYTAYLAYRGRSLITALSLGQYGEFSEDLSTSSSYWFLNQGTRVLMSSSLLLVIYDKKHRWLTKIAYLLSFMLVLSSGQRNQLMVVVLAPVIFYCFSRDKRPKIRHILVFILAFVVVLGYVGMWRKSFRTGGALEVEDINSVFTAFMVNIEVFFPYYTLLATVPTSFPHQWGMSYLYTFIQFIPRALWPNKPVSAVTNVTIAMYGETWAAAGPAYPNFAEMYLDFGVIGMLIGMGIFARICQNMYRNVDEHNKLSIVSFSLFLPYLFQYITRGHFPSVATEVFFMWGPIWALRLLSKVKRNS